MNTTTENTYDTAKIENLDRKILEHLACSITKNCSEIYNLNTSLHLSYESWYKVYITSEEFQNLDREKKLEVIDQYNNMSLLFEETLDFMSENELGEIFNNFYKK